MRKLLLTLTAVLLAVGLNAQTFEWGTASWNIEDGKVYNGIEELNAEGITLTYTNPNNYTLTFLNVATIEYDLFIDDATEPLAEQASAQGSVAITFDYPFAEGHKYKIVTKKALLAEVNLATRTADNIAEDATSYSISFTVEGPELVKTFDVEAYQSLSIIDQNEDVTYSAIDTTEIINALGIKAISEATIYGLNPNGSYNVYFGKDWYDGWRDVNGEYTTYAGGWDGRASRNATPAVYSIKISDKADSLFYYFYDYWSEYKEDAPTETGGSTINGTRRRASTSYHNIVWEWDNGDGTTTKYNRSYRVDEGSDYKASFAVVANKKYVLINATLHFISQEAYAELNKSNDEKKYEGYAAVGVSVAAQPGTPLTGVATSAQTVSVTKTDAEGKANVTFSGFSVAMPPMSIENLTIPVSVSEDNGKIIYTTTESVPVSFQSGAMSLIYYASLRGEQASADSAPVFVLTLSQASIITVAFNATEELAKETINAEYANVTAVESVKTTNNIVESYNANGISTGKSAIKGFNIIRLSDGSTRKVIK
ncbi:MAG: hypothetical protein J5663_06595 [Bacteroidaceae bacterium]|nr:hypothetical protein [Bacteroidaceae bacterium]